MKSNLKDFYLENQEIKNGSGGGSSSLPIIIDLIQYHNSWSKHNNTWPNGNESYWEKVDDHGTMGNSYYAYSIDCRHKCLKLDYDPNDIMTESENFSWLNNIFIKNKYPQVKKSLLEEKFYIVEIPDYGHQAMSPFYRDFIVLVYTNDGLKVPQKFVGIIRSYVKKTAYILIDKNNGVLNNSTTVDVKVLFKNNIETKDFTSDSKTFVEFNTVEDTNRHTLKLVINNISEISDFGEISDYEIVLKEGITIYSFENIYNTSFITSIIVSQNSNKDIISTQTSSENSSNRDYFKQSFEYDYLNKTNEVYSRNVIDSITLETSIPSSYKGKDFMLIRKNNLFEFLMGKTNNAISLSTFMGAIDEQILEPHKYSVYISNGKRCIPDNYTTSNFPTYTGAESGNIVVSSNDSSFFEIIPEFTNRKKLFLVDSVYTGDKYSKEYSLFMRNMIECNLNIPDGQCDRFVNGYRLKKDQSIINSCTCLNVINIYGDESINQYTYSDDMKNYMSNILFEIKDDTSKLYNFYKKSINDSTLNILEDTSWNLYISTTTPSNTDDYKERDTLVIKDNDNINNNVILNDQLNINSHYVNKESTQIANIREEFKTRLESLDETLKENFITNDNLSIKKMNSIRKIIEAESSGLTKKEVEYNGNCFNIPSIYSYVVIELLEDDAEYIQLDVNIDNTTYSEMLKCNSGGKFIILPHWVVLKTTGSDEYTENDVYDINIYTINSSGSGIKYKNKINLYVPSEEEVDIV